MQSNEIQQLEDEINILSRKGGHVLPPQRNGQLTKNGGAPFHGHWKAGGDSWQTDILVLV